MVVPLMCSPWRLYEPQQSHDNYKRKEGGEDEKKQRFMSGLKNTAPELFEFIHGEDTVDNRRVGRQDSPPILIRPESPILSPAPINQPKVFTFGRDSDPNLRNASFGSRNDISGSTTNLNKPVYGTNSMSRHSSGNDSGTYSSNSIKRATSNVQDGNRRQSTFNMKTEGGSLLYSPSFRERTEQLRLKKEKIMRDAELAGKRHRENTTPILIQVPDYGNSR